MFIKTDKGFMPYYAPNEAFLDGLIEIHRLTNRTTMVSYESPSVHYEKACRNEDLFETIDHVIDTALDQILA